MAKQSSASTYLHAYNFMRLKRFLTQTLFAFVFQYFTIMNFDFTLPSLPLYAPIGVAFILFYILGSNATLGLLLGCCFGYLLNGFTIESLLLYSLADMGGGYLSAYYCQRNFSQDINPFSNWKETVNFLKIDAFLICVLSAFFRGVAFGLLSFSSSSLETLPSYDLSFYAIYFFDFWLADLNAILVISAFVLSWVTVPQSREKIFRSPYLMVTLVLFVTTTLYLAYFLIYKTQFILKSGLEGYSLVPLSLSLYIIGTIYFGLSDRGKSRMSKKAKIG